jgi:hypothetical protein
VIVWWLNLQLPVQSVPITTKVVIPVSSTNKTYCHDIAEILLKVVLDTINQIFLC